jgi:hypothetical protein
MRRLTLTAALCTPLLWACGPTTSTSAGASSGNSTKGSSSGSGLYLVGATSGSVAGSTVGGSTAGTGTAGTGSSGGPAAGTSGSSGTSAGPCTAMTVAAARAAAVDGASVCPTNVVTLMANSFGAAVDGGGTQYAGTYYVIDPTSGLAIEVYKSKHTGPTATDPQRGASVDVAGTVTVYPFDGGAVGLPEVEGPGLAITAVSAGTLPTPVLATSAQVAPQGPDSSLVGHYVQVGPGTWTQNNAPSELTTTSSRGPFPHGAKLTDADGGTLLIETYTFKSSTDNCIPPDGGEPDFTGGNFRGVFDQTQTYDGNFNRILYFGHCDMGPPAATTTSTGSTGSSTATTTGSTSSGTSAASSTTTSIGATTGRVSAITTAASSSTGGTTGATTGSGSSTASSSSTATASTATSASSSSGAATSSSGSIGTSSSSGSAGVAMCGACTADTDCASGCCDDGSVTCGFTSGFCNNGSGCLASSDCNGIACDTSTFSCECPGFGTSSSSGSTGTSGSSSGSTGSSGSSGNTCASCTSTSQCPGGHCLKETGGAGNYFCGPDCTSSSDTSCPTGFTCSEIETGEYGCRSAAPTCD